MDKRWQLPLFALALAAAGLMLLALAGLRQQVLFPEDVDVVLLTLALLLFVFIGMLLLVRERMRFWVRYSIEKARNETLAEHRRFMRRLDHELKNPIMALRAGLGTLTLTTKAPHERELINTLSLTVQRLSLLVTSLRKLADLDTLIIDDAAIDPQQLLQEAVDLIREPLTLAGLHFQFQPPPPAPGTAVLLGDHNLLLLALHNLLENAVKYSQPGGRVSLSAHLADHMLVIEIADTGIGIPAAEKTLIWEELYRGANVGAIPGMGIGLSMTRAIIERHGGDIRLESAEGRGTTVTLALPLNTYAET